MQDASGAPYALEPRVILENVVRRFHHHGLYPVIAPEIEFYLIDQQTRAMRSQGCFHMAVLLRTPPSSSGWRRWLLQKLPLTGIVSEAEPAQFELNLRHSHQRLSRSVRMSPALRRLTSVIANEFGYKANFMAKPFPSLPATACIFISA